LKLQKCRLQFKKKNYCVIYYNFRHTFVPYRSLHIRPSSIFCCGSHSVEQSSCRIQRPDNQRCLLSTAFKDSSVRTTASAPQCLARARFVYDYALYKFTFIIIIVHYHRRGLTVKFIGRGHGLWLELRSAAVLGQNIWGGGLNSPLPSLPLFFPFHSLSLPFPPLPLPPPSP